MNTWKIVGFSIFLTVVFGLGLLAEFALTFSKKAAKPDSVPTSPHRSKIRLMADQKQVTPPKDAETPAQAEKIPPVVKPEARSTYGIWEDVIEQQDGSSATVRMKIMGPGYIYQEPKSTDL